MVLQNRTGSKTALVPLIVRLCTLLVVVGLVAAAGAYLASFAAHAWLLTTYPYPLDYGEGPLLTQVRMLWAGTPVWDLYRSPAAPPYTIVNYPPTYPLLVAMVSLPLQNVLLAGRLVSLFAAVGCVGAVVLLATPRGTRPPPRTVALALLFLTIPIVREWSVFLRVDMAGVCFGLWGLVALQRRWFVLAGLLLTLSLFAKPSLVAAPLAAVVWCVLLTVRRDLPPRSLLVLLVATGGSGVLLTSLLQSGSDGWFLLHVIDANANRWDANLARGFWLEQAQLRWPLALAAVAGLLGVATSTQRHPGQDTSTDTTLAALYTLAALLTAAGVGKVGAYTNYFLELYAGLVWLVCATTGRRPVLAAASVTGSRRAAFAMRASLVLLLMSLAFSLPMWSKTTLYRAGLVEPNPPRLAFGRYTLWHDVQREAAVLAALQRVHTALVPEVQAAGGAIYTDVPGVAAEAGRMSRVQLFEHRQLYDQGLWDQRPLLLDMANGRVPLAVIDYVGNWMTPHMVTLLTHRYAQDGTRGMFDLYRPVAPGPRLPAHQMFVPDVPGAPDTPDVPDTPDTPAPALLLSGYHLRTSETSAGAVPDTAAPLRVAAGDTLLVTLEWQRVADRTVPVPPPTAPLTVVLSLTDENGHPLLEHRRPLLYGALPPGDWPPATPVQHMHPLRVPPNLPPRSYRLVMGLVSNRGDTTAPESHTSLVLAVVRVEQEPAGFVADNGLFVPPAFAQAWVQAGGSTWAGQPLTPVVPFAWGALQCYEFVCLEQRGEQVVQRPLGEQHYLAETLRSDECLGGESRVSKTHPCLGFAAFWQQHGGMAEGGIGPGPAISGEHERNGYIVQWTSNARLERLPGASPEQVIVGRLGEESLQLPPGTRYRWPGE